MLTNQLNNAIQSLWNDKATIIGTQPNIDDSPYDDNADSIIIKNEPAKVISKSIKPNQQLQYGNEDYDAILLIRNGINIPSGCEIYITDLNGNETKYQYSSKGYTGYYTHQEIAMTLSEKA